MERRTAVKYSVGISAVAGLVLASISAVLGGYGLLVFLMLFSWWVIPAIAGVTYWVLRTDTGHRRFRTVVSVLGVSAAIYMAVPVIELLDAGGCDSHKFSSGHQERYCPPAKGFVYRMLHGGTFGG